MKDSTDNNIFNKQGTSEFYQKIGQNGGRKWEKVL